MVELYLIFSGGNRKPKLPVSFLRNIEYSKTPTISYYFFYYSHEDLGKRKK